jgi:phosphoribosylglycinamide formyltransferase-1
MSVRVAVLLSGSGTNLQALIDATTADHPAEIALVIADRHKAFGLKRAAAAGIPTEVVLKRDHPSREAYDEALVGHLRRHDIQWIALAGFMRLVTPVLLDAFPLRVLNIHPALLPTFPGLRAQKQAFDYGVKIAGATVHFVDLGTDTGPIIAQGAVPVLTGDDEHALQERILAMEHRLYPLVLRWAADGHLSVEGRQVSVAKDPATFLWSPQCAMD